VDRCSTRPQYAKRCVASDSVYPHPPTPRKRGAGHTPNPTTSGGLWKVLAAGLAKDDTMMMRQTMGSDYKLQDAGRRPALPGDRVGWESSEAGV